MTKDTRTDSFDDHTGSSQANTTRRELLSGLGEFAAGVAAVAAPAAVGLVGSRAFASHGATVDEVLEFALTLEYLEAEFYTQGVSSGVLSGGDADGRAEGIFSAIRDNEQSHVDLLEGALGLDEGENKPDFDFTAGGMFDPFGDYATFLLLSQAFEDTGVRAYKGQAHALIDDDDTLTTALQIHSVEARHAAIVRRLRGNQAWIPLDQPGVNSAAAPVYAGEDQTTELGVDLSAALDFDDEPITESFDEPLGMDQVLPIATMFISS